MQGLGPNFYSFRLKLMDEIETVVIGAGVVGLAIGRALAMAGQDVLVLEAESDFGTGISSRNSEVIHAGIYYPEGSLKARMCVEGKGLLYDYVKARHVPYRNCGKFIVATHDDQTGKLEEIKGKAERAGVFDLEWVTTARLKTEEPHVNAVAALWSPSTGIIDSHGLMQALLGDIEAHGGQLVCQTPVERVEVTGSGFIVTTGGPDPFSIRCKTLVNSAAFGAHKIAETIDGLDAAHVPPLYYARGCYFTLSGKPAFSRLIYPVPEPGGLGVHVTLDMGGQVKFGPDVEWIPELNYDLNPARAEKFYAAIRRYFPALPDDALQPGYTGVRPKLKNQGEGDADFVISGPDNHGIPGLINLFGIESPGLTSSLALASRVTAALGL
jgi:L-2-hydroxyglutarate oxidase LhgO